MSHWDIAMWTLAALLVFWGIGAYNRLMRLRNAISAAFVLMDEHLNARAVLCSKMLVLLEPLLSNEKATFDALESAQADVRAAAQATRPRPYMAEPVGALGVASAVHAAALTRLMSMLEHHSELREHADLYALVDELKLVERRRTFSRQLFNQAVWQFNEAITQFPTRILASLYGFREARSL